ncbi:MAG TPA: hypothetical protein PK176_04805 [Acidobacteriota bacterium]|nr:hypothetical protein [Acidobacteriota bacterium]HQM62608.1 hypothetical protein [Acidobacteriota bacterium]
MSWAHTRWVLALTVLAVTGCGGGTAPRYHAQSMLYLAVAVPAGTKLPAAVAGSLLPPLDELSRRRPDWAPAVAAGRRMLAKPGAVKLEIQARDTLVFPDGEYLLRFGQGFSESELVAAASADRALTLVAMVAPPEVASAYPALQAVALAAAEAWGGYVYDVSAKLPVAPAAYAGWRFNPAVCDLPRHVLIQQYPYQPGRLRMVTLGMSKFACPELEVRDYPPENAIAVRNLLAGAAGALIARSLTAAGPAEFPRTMDLPAAFLQAAGSRSVQLSEAAAGGGDRVRVAVAAGEADKGDPQEAVVRLGPVEPGGDLGRWTAELSRQLIGFGQQIDIQQGQPLQPDVLRAVQASLPALRDEFRAGLPAGSACFVQFRREAPGAGVELLWAQVVGWPDGGLDLQVVSQPVLARSLAAGDRIRCAEADVVDWAVRGADGGMRSFPRPANKP